MLIPKKENKRRVELYVIPSPSSVSTDKSSGAGLSRNVLLREGGCSGMTETRMFYVV
jgi:hypothetical protein